MSSVRLRYSMIGERWSIERVGLEGNYELISDSDQLAIARDESGAVVEMVIDSNVVPGDTLRIAVEAFGEQVRSYLMRTPTADFEVVLGPADQSDDRDGADTGRSVVRVPWRLTVSESNLPGEPGMPVAVSPQLFEVQVPVDTIDQPGDGGSESSRRIRIEHRARESELVVTFDGLLLGGPWWVRFGDGESGTTIALGRLEESVVNRMVEGDIRTELAMSTRVTFALDLPISDLHVSVSDTPLVDVGDRRLRRRRWADDLDHRASQIVEGDPERAAILWAEAAVAYRSFGDEVSAQECDERAAECRGRSRRRLVRVAVVAILLAGLVALALALAADRDDQGTPSVDAETSISPATSPETTASDTSPADVEPDSGPVELTFDPTMTAIVELGTAEELDPGADLVVSVRTTVRIQSLYDRAGCLAVEAGIPVDRLGPTTGPTPAFAVEIRRVTDDGGTESIPLEPFAVGPELFSFIGVPGSCKFGEDDPTQVESVPVDVTFVPTEVTFKLPVDIAAGVWSLVLTNGSIEGSSADGRVVAFRVSGSVR